LGTLNTAAIAGSVGGVVGALLVTLIAGLIFFFRRKNKQRNVKAGWPGWLKKNVPVHDWEENGAGSANKEGNGGPKFLLHSTSNLHMLASSCYYLQAAHCNAKHRGS